jgi:hypothetical protein
MSIIAACGHVPGLLMLHFERMTAIEKQRGRDG